MKIIRWFAFLPAVFMMIVIFSFSGEDGDESSSLSLRVSEKIIDTVNYITGDNMSEDDIDEWTDNIHFYVRKGAHMTEYAILVSLIYFGFYMNYMKKTLYIGISFAITVLYASTDELHQHFIAGRSGNIKDVFIDSTGALIACLIVFLVKKIHNKRLNA